MRDLFRLAVPVWIGILAVPLLESAGEVDFARDIRPILAESCYGCHGPQVQMAGLRLDVKPGGAIIVPGDSAKSALVQRITAADAKIRMPLGGQRLAPEKIELVRQWIAAGAPWSDATAGTAANPKKHWAFVPPVRPPAPRVSRPEWVRNPIDAFVLAHLDKENLKPSPEADRATLLRRLSLDLIGLPPTLAELDAFLADRSPERVREAGRPACSPRRTTASGGAASGWTPRAMPIPTGMRRTRRDSSGSIATG